ncbi:MAG TPA: hypothetical protein VEZ11_03330, partial [Thermoanaerobaculia bacterium]|nr:hypothetical protein [Thermoanaerobaculia bacterium]
VAISARSIGPIFFRTGYTISKQDVTVTPDLSEIVVNSPFGQGGQFERKVDTFDALAGVSGGGFTLAGSFKEDHADNPIFRTDFLTRQRYRVRGSWAAPKFVRLGLAVERTGQKNDQPDIGLEGKIRQSTADFEFTPMTALSFRGSYSQYRADSNISYRVPQNFNIAESVHSEKGNALEGGFSVLLKPFSFDASLGQFQNTGTTPFHLNRYRVRVVYDFQEKTGVAAEFARDRYTEPFPSLGTYLAKRYGLFLRYRP